MDLGEQVGPPRLCLPLCLVLLGAPDLVRPRLRLARRDPRCLLSPAPADNTRPE